MAIEVANTETINGIKIDYLTDWDNRFGPKGLKEMMKGYGKFVSELALTRGYKRVQIASLGDFYYFGISDKLFLLNTGFAARFLKR